MFRSCFVTLLALFCFHALAAQNDSARVPLRLLHFGAEPHSAKKATIYSAVLPGLGQIYNHKYWKAPIVWAAMGGALWYMEKQRAEMWHMNEMFRFRYSDTLLPVPTDEERALRDKYRRGRDIGILALSGLYVIQIVDAAVDAHFFRFDINQSLSAQIRPSSYGMFSVQYRF